MVDVFVNGVKFVNGTDFTATNGTTVVMAAGLAAGNIVEIDNLLTAYLPTNALRTITTFTATAGQTTFSVTYTQGLIDVFYNGSCLAQSEYTATNGTSIILATACQLNDIVVVYAYSYSVGAYSGIGGSGTTNYVPKFSSSSAITNSLIYDNGTNVGIGNTNTTYKLEVTGTLGVAAITSTGQFNLTPTSGSSWLYLTQGTSSNTAYISWLNPSGNRIGYLGSSATNISLALENSASFVVTGGNVGIGTSSPSAKFVVSDGTNNILFTPSSSPILRADSSTYFDINNQGGGLLRLYASSGIWFRESGNEPSMAISGGNVGINTTAPNAKLDIVGPSNAANTYGTLLYRNTSNTGICFGASGTSYTWMQGNVFGSGTQMISINPQGSNVSIGTTTDYGYKLNLNGQPGCNGYTAWTNWSDSRLKENVIDFDANNVLDKISKIRPVTYNYNELSGFDEATRSRRISGFIAQELMEVFPDMVGTITKEDGKEYYDTNLSNLDLYLVKAIQELYKKLQRNNIN
jgi:hypothetical protein